MPRRCIKWDMRRNSPGACTASRTLPSPSPSSASWPVVLRPFRSATAPAAAFTAIIGWIVGGLFALIVGACMAQIASAYPTAGGLYHWSSILGGRAWGWVTAWFNLLGLIFVISSVNVGVYNLVHRPDPEQYFRHGTRPPGALLSSGRLQAGRDHGRARVCSTILVSGPRPS